MESSLTAAVSTGVMMTPATRVVLDYALVNENSRGQWLMGCQGNLGMAFVSSMLNRLAYILEDDAVSGPISPCVVDTARHVAVFDGTEKRISFITGCCTNFTTVVSTAVTKDGTVPIGLFARCVNAGGTAFENYANARIYSFETLTNGVTSHLFVPCAGGFKDVLTDDAVRACATTGTLTFVAGYGSADDYRLEAGVVSCRMVGTAQVGGTVSIDGADGATSVSNWVVRGETASFAATAADGFVFSHWQGETAAIVDGLATDASVTVRADRALQLKAVFRSATPGVSALHYVRKGLVVQYDGVENAGVGVHDTSSRTWVDLSENGYDGTLGSAIAWGETGWTNNQNGKPVDTGTALGPVLATRRYTLEFACRPTRKTTREVFVGQYSGENRGLNIEHNSSAAQQGQVRLWFGGIPDLNTDVIVDANAETALSLAVTPAEQRLYRFGSLVLTRTEALTYPVDSSDRLIIGGENHRETMAFRGTFHAFRLYDRALAPEEVQLNNALDAVRYRGVAPSSLTLPGGCFFDAAGTPCFRLTAEAVGRGTVALDGGVAAGAVTNTAPLNGACSATLTATPDAGSVFTGWEGDVGAIVRGDASTATITVTATEATALVATFSSATRPLLPTTGHYATNGLVLWFDGIENAGRGVHDATVRTWKDLSGHNRDGALNANVSWTDTGWQNSAAGRPVQVTDTAVAQAVSTKDFSVEFTCSPSRKTSRESFASLYNGKNGLSIEHNSSGAKNGQIRLYLDGQPNYESSVILDANETAAVSVAVGEYGQEFYKNGVVADSRTTRVTGTFPTTSTFVVGGEPSRDSQAFYGTFNTCRVYDHRLSAGEALANGLADMLRYRGFEATVWTNAAGGAWSESGNWSADVPNPRMLAVVQMSVPDYTIAVHAQAPSVTNLYLANGVGTTCVDIADGGALEVKTGRMLLADGGRIQVGPGGSFAYDGAGVINGQNDKVLTVNGGTLAVTGGTVDIRNFTGKMAVQGIGASTGVVSITDGSLTFTAGNDQNHHPQILPGGRLEMTGGSFTYTNPQAMSGYQSFLNGGVIDLSGTATCSFVGTAFQAKGGRIHLGGNAKLRCSSYPTSGDATYRFLLSSAVAGGYTELTAEGAASVELGGQQAMAYLANNTAGERAVVNWNSTGSFVAEDTLAVGFRKGYGELNVTKGCVIGGGYGLRIGQGSGSIYGGDAPTGVVNVAGGCLGTTDCWNGVDSFNGLVVGAGNFVDLTNPGFYRGTLNVSGGVVTNASKSAFLGVGIGFAEGDVNQTGGEIVHWGTTYQLVVGAWGGTGRWTTAGGRTLARSDVYVGGILTNQVAYKSGSRGKVCPVTRHNASGTLVVSNGSFTVQKTLYAGEDGTASITLGENGTLAAAAASLKNTTLTYAFGATGTGALNVTGALTIGANAALVVDATDFAAKSGVFPILSCASQTGEFSSITVRNGHGMMVVKTATGYVARKVSGSMLIIR